MCDPAIENGPVPLGPVAVMAPIVALELSPQSMLAPNSPTEADRSAAVKEATVPDTVPSSVPATGAGWTTAGTACNVTAVGPVLFSPNTDGRSVASVTATPLE